MSLSSSDGRSDARKGFLEGTLYGAVKELLTVRAGVFPDFPCFDLLMLATHQLHQVLQLLVKMSRHAYARSANMQGGLLSSPTSAALRGEDMT